jgi:hypothetical protein
LAVSFFSKGDKKFKDFLNMYKYKKEEGLQRIVFNLIFTGYLKLLQPMNKLDNSSEQVLSSNPFKSSLEKLLSKLQKMQSK